MQYEVEGQKFVINGKTDESDFYINDGKFVRFVGWTGHAFIPGIQSGIPKREADCVRFDQTTRVMIYEIVNGEGIARPNLTATWS